MVRAADELESSEEIDSGCGPAQRSDAEEPGVVGSRKEPVENGSGGPDGATMEIGPREPVDTSQEVLEVQDPDGSLASGECVGRELTGEKAQEISVAGKVVTLDGKFSSPSLTFLVDTGAEKSFIRRDIF
jgi:hypothetical protein